MSVLTMVVCHAQDVLLAVLVRRPGLVLHPGADGELWTEVVIEDGLRDNHAVASVELVDWPSLPALVPIELTDPGGRV